MKIEVYNAKRKELMDKAQALLDEGKAGEEYENAYKEITDLDTQFDKEAKAQANLDALSGSRERGSFENAAVQVPGGISAASFNSGTMGSQTTDDFTNSTEYQTAFMNFVCRNTPIPGEMLDRTKAMFRNDVTTTGDASAVIPTTIVQEFIKKLESYGNIYSKVRKLNIRGGVEVPILDLKPTAHWIGETAVSAEQKLEAKDKVSFSYYGLECRVSQTLLASIVTLEMFQKEFIPLMVEAVIKALEIATLHGTGSGQMLGITVDSRVPTDNVIEVSDADISNWASWKKKVFAKMKRSYRNGEFVMAQGTFDTYIDGLVDANGQPIGRVNYGITDGEKYRFGGKNVETVEDDILPSFDSATAGDVVAVFIDWKNYAINSNMQMRTVKWEDHDTNTIKNKVILICDGKLLDPKGVLIIKKK